MFIATVAEVGISAGAAAIATVLAAGFGGFITLMFQRRSEAARAERAATAAWNLITIELGDALKTVYDIQQDQRWPIGRHRTWADAWQNSKQALLEYPRDQEILEKVMASGARLDMLESAVNAPRAGYELSSNDELFLSDMQRLLEEACEALGGTSERRRPDRSS